VRRPNRLTIGPRTSIGENAILDARGKLTIGHDVNFSTQVHVWTAQHDWKSEDFAYTEGAVTIGSRAWIGPRVTILPGVNIGEGAVIAAGSVVTGDVAEFSLVAGAPARVIGVRPRSLMYRLVGAKGKPWWW
jgi:acetyltransferase-like isoleucine patch superfamily enzyme